MVRSCWFHFLNLRLQFPLTDRVVGSVKARLECATEPWEDLDILGILHTEREALGLSTKVFMKALRCAITGMKVRRDFVSWICAVPADHFSLSRMDLHLQML